MLQSIGDTATAEGNRVDDSFGKIAKGVAAVFTVQQALAFAKSVVQVRGEIESLSISFETLLGNKQQAAAMFSEIKDFAVSTPMQMNDLAKGAQTLLSFNIEAERVMPILKQIGDISMGDAQKFNSLTLAFSQMSSTGRLMGQDLLQMINAGFNPLTIISEKTGKSIAQLKKEMESGAISSKMVSDAFSAATAEGGKFHGMLEKQSKGMAGSLSNLQGAITDMFNGIGESSQGFITNTIQGATTAVQHYKEIGEALAVIVATYGTYKAAVMATEAVQRSIETVKRTEEAAELMKLLSVEQQAKISKLGLAKTSVEYAAAVKAEVAANVQGAQSALTKARADVVAANQSVVARREEYIAAKQLESQRLAELMSIGATGSAKQVEAAQRKLSAAEMQRESAALAFQSASRDFNAKKTAVETAARTANTTATAANTAVQTANVTATGILSVAKTRLTAVAARLNAVIMANPYALAAAAVIALAYGIYKLVTYQTDAEKAQKKLNKSIDEFNKEVDSERSQIDSLFARLKNAKKGTDEYRSAKEAIMSRYGQYLKGLGDEKTALDDVAKAYSVIAKEAEKAARARAMDAANKEASDTFAKEQGEAKKEIKELLEEKYKGKKYKYDDGTEVSLAKAYYEKIKAVIDGQAEITPEIQKIINDFNVKTLYVSGVDDKGRFSYKETFKNELTNVLEDVKAAKKIYEDVTQQAIDIFGESQLPVKDTVFDAATASLQQLMDKLPQAKESLKELHDADTPDPKNIADKKAEIALISQQIEAREKGLKTINEVKAQIENLEKEQLTYGKDDKQYLDLEKRIQRLKTKLPSKSTGGTNANEEAKRLKQEHEERLRRLDEYAKEEERRAEELELEKRQAKNDLLAESFDKEAEQIAINYDRMQLANKERERKMVEELRKKREMEWQNENPDYKKTGKSFDPNTITAADLSQKQKDTIEEFAKFNAKLKTDAEEDLQKKLLEKYKNFEQRRNDITAQFAKDRKEIQDNATNEEAKNNALAVLEKHEREAIKAVNNEEFASMQKSSDLLVKLFSDASQRSVRELRTIISTTEELLTYLEKTDSADITPKFGFTAEELKTLKESPEKLKALREAIKELNGELGSRSPFLQFKNDIEAAMEAIKHGDIEVGIEGIGNAIQGITPRLKQFGGDLATIFGSSEIGDDISNLTDLIGGIGKGILGIGQIASGDILGGITSLVSGIASIFSMANAATERHQEALDAVMNAKIAQQREYNLLLFKQNLLYEQGATIFGNDGYGKARNSIILYRKALEDLNNALHGSESQKNDQINRSRFLRLRGLRDEQSAIKQIYSGLADIKVVTGHKKTGLFGWGKGKDLYSSILDVYPKLITANGDFNKELAQSILQTKKMSEADKASLQNLINLFDQYEESLRQARDYLTGIFGEFGNTITNVLVDAFKNGTDSAQAFFDSVSGMLENLAKQMIYSVTLAPLMEEAQKKMLEVMKNGELTDAQKFDSYTTILSNLTTDALAQQDTANALFKQFKDMAASKGIDIFKSDDQRREASKRGIATASQESVDENNGRLTAIQGHTSSILESVKLIHPEISHVKEMMTTVRGLAAEQLKTLRGIEVNTSSLSSIRTDIGDLKTAIGLIVDRGILIRK